MNHKPESGFTHEKIETNNLLMVVLILLVIAVGGMVEIVPLFSKSRPPKPSKGSSPIPPCNWPGAMCMCAKVVTTAIRK